jgi:hypothetical protein
VALAPSALSCGWATGQGPDRLPAAPRSYRSPRREGHRNRGWVTTGLHVSLVLGMHAVDFMAGHVHKRAGVTAAACSLLHAHCAEPWVVACCRDMSTMAHTHCCCSGMHCARRAVAACMPHVATGRQGPSCHRVRLPLKAPACCVQPCIVWGSARVCAYTDAWRVAVVVHDARLAAVNNPAGERRHCMVCMEKNTSELSTPLPPALCAWHVLLCTMCSTA